jgi:hypothetical protein
MTERAVALPDNRLSFTDQAMFLWLRASGEEPVMQIVWIYEHPVDFDGLRRFHHAAGQVPLGRLRIERSPLPFGRHRWVLSEGPQADMDIVEGARPRAELSDWADERARLPVDPEWGPGWHMGVLRCTDGSTAVSVVISHCLADGLGGLSVVGDVIKGNSVDFGYPQARSRSRRRAIAADARATLQGAPEVARALRAAARLAFRRRRDLVRSKASRPAKILGNGTDCNVVVPAIAIYVNLEEWDARAKQLGGNGHSLVAGFAAKLGEQMGRCRSDGAVTLLVPTSDRTEDSARKNAATLAHISVDPTRVTSDLSVTQTTIRQGLQSARQAPDQPLELLPLVPFVPKWAVKRGGDAIFGFAADLPVSCSNLGDLDSAIASVDGTEAEYVMLRGVNRCITRQALEQRRGLLTLVAGRICGKMSISVVAYQPGAQNSKSHLRELAARTLKEFGLTGVID